MVFQGLTCLTRKTGCWDGLLVGGGQALMLGLFPLFKTGLLLTWFVVVLSSKYGRESIASVRRFGDRIDSVCSYCYWNRLAYIEHTFNLHQSSADRGCYRVNCSCRRSHCNYLA
ncbi:hypothetical protein ACTXL8_17845, partial [Glutamicibacter arilaitensis]